MMTNENTYPIKKANVVSSEELYHLYFSVSTPKY